LGLLGRERRRRQTELALRDSEQRLRQLSGRLLANQEVERSRISAELHDDVAHSLVLMKLQLGLIARQIREDPSAAVSECRELSDLVDQLIEHVRGLFHELRPPLLEDLGLSAALRWLTESSIGNGIAVEHSLIDVDSLVAPTGQIALYRIIQEALMNVRKHAEATRVSLQVERPGDWLSFVVEDNGKGFDVTALRTGKEDGPERGIGLITMHERARMLDACLGIRSERGKGTRITLGVPVRNGNGTHGALSTAGKGRP
jgi:signal transduction histidine kinase